MAVATGQVSCPSDADTVIVPALVTSRDGSAVSGLPRRQVAVKNAGSWDVYLGTGTETAATGYLFASGDAPLVMTLRADEALYGRAAQNTGTIHYLISGE